MQILPPAKNKALLAAVTLICSGLVYLCFLLLWLGGVGRVLFMVFFLMPLALGLWRLKELARRVVSVLIMACVFLVPPGLINPFAAMNRSTADMPDVWELALMVYPWVALGLLLVHILGKHRAEFLPLGRKQGVE